MSPLADILSEGLVLVVCGSAAGERSAQLSQYYAGRGNRFWSTLAELGLTPRQLTPAEADLLPGFGIGLTDLVKDQSGADDGIRFERASADDLRRKMLTYRPAILCFNGKRAAKEFFAVREIGYGLHVQSIGNTQLFVAPSTSAAANGSWEAAWWQDLARLVRASCAWQARGDR